VPFCRGRVLWTVRNKRKLKSVKPVPQTQSSGIVVINNDAANQARVVRRGRKLEYFTIVYNSLEGLVGIVSGLVAGSIALVGFGFDSLIEVTSGVALLWCLHQVGSRSAGQQAERKALHIVGACFVFLAAYIAYDSLLSMVHQHAPERSPVGIILAITSLIVMPVLARAKRRVAQRLGSVAMRADAKQADFCTYLSAILLTGLVLNAQLGWWWADPAAAFIMVPIIAKEGVESLKGRTCCEHGDCH
jgi:divalent metal cation (Fe/Co/Zn/Cd) transporter